MLCYDIIQYFKFCSPSRHQPNIIKSDRVHTVWKGVTSASLPVIISRLGVFVILEARHHMSSLGSEVVVILSKPPPHDDAQLNAELCQKQRSALMHHNVAHHMHHDEDTVRVILIAIFAVASKRKSNHKESITS